MTKKENVKRLLSVCFFVCLVTAMTSGDALAQSPLQGSWILTKVVDPDGMVDSEPHRGLIIFTSDHYSVLHARGAKPRALMDADNPTDAQILEAYQSITANSGRYEVEGNQFTTRAYVAKNPNYMDRWPDNINTFSFSIDGDMLEVTNASGNAEGTKRTYRRVEGSPPPWK